MPHDNGSPGQPKPIADRMTCKETLEIADDFGDNHALRAEIEDWRTKFQKALTP